MSLTLFDNAHWLFAQPVKPAPGTVLDFSGTRLEATFTSMFGGSAEPVVVVSSDAADGEGKVTFVPASGNVGPYFLFDVPVTARNWRASLAQTVYADVLRAPDPSKPDDKFVLGRVEAKIYPGTGSAGIANPSQFPVLYPTQPYGGLPLSAPMLIGPQGTSGAPNYQIITDQAGILAIDISEGGYVKAVLSEPAALAIMGWPTDFEMGRLTLELDIAAGATLTGYPTGTIWSNGTAPVLSVGPAKDVLMFTSIDGGATVFGHLIGQNYR